MPGLDGLEFISRIRPTHPKLPVLVLTMHEEDQYVIRVFAGGANGYITKRSAPEQLVNAIRKVYGGGRYVNGSAAEALALHMAKGTPGRTLLDSLSNREMQVLRRLAMGLTPARSPKRTTSVSRPRTPTVFDCSKSSISETTPS